MDTRSTTSSQDAYHVVAGTFSPTTTTSILFNCRLPGPPRNVTHHQYCCSTGRSALCVTHIQQTRDQNERRYQAGRPCGLVVTLEHYYY